MMCIILCYKSNIHFYAQLSFILNIVGENTIGYSTSCDILLKMVRPSSSFFLFFVIKWSKQVQTEHFIKIHVQNPISPLPPFIFYLTRFSIQENHTKSLTFSYQLSTHLHGVYIHSKPFQNTTSRILHTIVNQFPYIS